MPPPSPGAVSRVVGYSTTDPTTTFVRGIHTLKNGSYYKRNWASGNPYSSVPVWLDMDHCPPQQREFIVRPDLALTAMQRILGRIEQASRPHPLAPHLLASRSRWPAQDRSLLLVCSEPLSPPCLLAQEELGELARRQALQDTRQERLARLRQRHMQRHHAQQNIGVREPQGVQKDFNQKSMVRLHRSASAASSLEQRQYLEPSSAAEDGADASIYSEAGSPSASHQASGQRGLSSSSSMDLLAQIAPVGEICMLKKAPRAMMYRGMEGLCLPRYPILATNESRAST